MSGLQINVTPAGRAAIVNAENTGTASVRIAQIGVTSSGTGLVAGALAGELKRLVTFAGAAVADDTVHVTLRDDGADVYTLRGFALYLEDGALFAWYAQAGVILEKSAQAMLLLAADVRFVQIDATSLTFGDTHWINPPATTAVQGVVELADPPESIAGLDGTRAMTPAGTRALLDDRFGTGAPSAFVKGLLNLATAALFRAALEIKSAALKDTGAGNGLDADLLDGQHGAYYLSWANLTGKPATFPPSAHTHAWADLSNPPATATRWPGWTEVTGKPTAFTPAAHTHAAADITSGTLADVRIAQTNVTQHQASLSITWGQITGEPATYAPSAHTHDGNDIGGRLGTAAKTTSDWNAATDNGWWMAYGAANAPSASTWYIGEAVKHNDNWITQTVWEFAGNHRIVYRRQKFDGVWGAWERCRIHESEQDARYFKNSGGPIAGDITVYRPGSPTTGVVYLGNNSGSRYLYWDGANYQLGGFGAIWSSGNFDPNSKVNVADTDDTGLASKVVRRNGDGDVNARLFRPSYGNEGYLSGAIAFRVDNSSNNYIRFCSDPAAVRGWLGAAALSGANFTGAVTAPTITGTSSDARLKTEIDDLRDCLEIVKRMRPRRWQWIESGEPDFGYIAQEHREVLPGAVHENEDGLLFVRYGKAEALLVGAVQELAVRLDAIEARLRGLQTVR